MCILHCNLTPFVLVHNCPPNRYEERILKYYDTQLALKGSLELGKDLKVRLVDSKEVEGRPNAFEITTGAEK